MSKVVTFGEIMLRLATPACMRFGQTSSYEATFGGGEANVAVSLANYGISADFATRLPDNDLGRACASELRSFGVNVSNIIYGGDRIGIYFLETGAVARPSKVIYDRANSSIATVRPGMIDWERIFKDASWFHWTGITPAISLSAAETCREAISVARKMGLTISCDINYRRNLWKYGSSPSEIMPALVAECDLILGNEEDAEQVFGIKPAGFDAAHAGGQVEGRTFESVCIELKKRFPRASRIVITLRGSVSASHNTWGGVMYSSERFYESPRYNITHIIDRVGGGDAFMGGLIYGLLTYADDSTALGFAAASSCLKHTIHGDFNRVTVAEVEKLMSGDASGRVGR
jgi:2-dehydro-3-deoxygluconokinase